MKPRCASFTRSSKLKRRYIDTIDVDEILVVDIVSFDSRRVPLHSEKGRALQLSLKNINTKESVGMLDKSTASLVRDMLLVGVF